MQQALLILLLIAIHIAFYSLHEKFTVLTLVSAVIWSTISFGIYILVSIKFDRWPFLVFTSCCLISSVYFLAYFTIIFPTFIELRILGHQIVHSNAITQSGTIYLIMMSIAEGLLFLIAFFVLRLIRHVRGI